MTSLSVLISIISDYSSATQKFFFNPNPNPNLIINDKYDFNDKSLLCSSLVQRYFSVLVE